MLVSDIYILLDVLLGLDCVVKPIKELLFYLCHLPHLQIIFFYLLNVILPLVYFFSYGLNQVLDLGWPILTLLLVY